MLSVDWPIILHVGRIERGAADVTESRVSRWCALSRGGFAMLGVFMGRNTTFLPSTDSGLLDWSANLAQKISSDPSAYGLDPEQCDAFALAQAAYASALRIANTPDTRTKISIIRKNQAREFLKDAARLINAIVKSQPNVSDAQKAELLLTVPAKRSKVPPPVDVPLMTVLSVVGRTVRVKLRRREGERRAWPDGVQGAAIFSYAGSALDEDTAVFQFQMNITSKEAEIDFPRTLPPGTNVWLTARYFNRRQELGPASPPIQTILQFSLIPLAA